MKKNKNKNKGKQNSTYTLLYQTTYFLYLYLIGLLLMFYVHDAYYDLMESKAACFSLIMKILLPFVLIVLILKIKSGRLKLVNNLFELGLLLMLFIAVISTVFSYAPDYAFSGQAGWHVGLFVILCLILVFFALKDEPFDQKQVYYPIVFACIIQFLLSITDAMKMDLFHFRDLIARSMYFNYYGTIGNCNWSVGFLSLLVPLFVCLYANENVMIKKLFYFFASLTGIVFSVLNGADGIYLAYGFCSFFLIPYLLSGIDQIKKTALLLSFSAFCFLLIGKIPSFTDRLAVMKGYGRIILNDKVDLVLLAVGIILYFFSRKTDNSKYQNIRKQMIVVCEVILAITALFAVLKAFGNLSDDFGNGRMAIWKLSFETYFGKYTLYHKLFGIGPELLQEIYTPLSQKYDMIYNSSHNEMIHMLMSMGLFGMLSWLMCWVSIFISYFRCKKHNDGLIVGLYSGLFAYFGQSMVNSATILNLCILNMIVIILFQYVDNNCFLSLFSKKRKEQALK